MRSFHKLIARMLMVCMAWTPFSLQAGMIGTDQVVASARDQESRDQVRAFMARGDVAKELESFGLTAAAAMERVDAMTQDEVNRMAGRIASMPAGGDGAGGWIGAIIIIGLIVWLVWFKK